MRLAIACFSMLLMTGCAVQTIDMADHPSIQKNDLSDSDGDGVIDAREKCETTVVGAQVDNYGCGGETLNKVRQELRVNFPNNSYVVAQEYFRDINQLAEFMNQYPDTAVVIEGHTSKQGSKKLNMALSQKRAQAVADILKNKFGIAASRISAMGYGFERLLDEGNNERAHARNRRIVAELSSEEQIPDMKWTIYSVDKSEE